MDKINAYIGFAIKSRKIVYGADNIVKTKACKLIVASSNLAQNTLQKLKNTNIKLISLPAEKFETFNLRGLAVGITDSSLADAIINSLAQ